MSMRHGAKKKYGSNECTNQFRQRGCVTGALVRMDLLLLFWVKTYLTQLQLCLAKALQQWQWELAARERAQACKDSLNSVEPHMNIQLLLWDFWPMEICSNDSSSRVFRQLSRIDPTVSNTCPSCGCINEDTSHVVRCPSPGRTAFYNDSVSDLIE